MGILDGRDEMGVDGRGRHLFGWANESIEMIFTWLALIIV
jgi:hypothetical protein